MVRPSRRRHASHLLQLTTAKDAAGVTNLPAYMFTSKRIREAVDMPCVYVNSSVRFDLQEINDWVRRKSMHLDE